MNFVLIVRCKFLPRFTIKSCDALIRILTDSLKNLPGWRTRRKIVVFSVDDYGNVRVDSRAARSAMDAAGLKVYSRFDAYDSLEDSNDLELLFETLSSVADSKGNHACFTAFAVPANINFEEMAANNYSGYIYEWLPDTFAKLAGYQGTWKLWKEGMERRLLVPQFHGREHLNVRALEEALKRKDRHTLIALKHRSYASLLNSGHATVSTFAAFDFWDFEENKDFDEIIREGLDGFEDVFGSRASYFNPPGGREHPYIHNTLRECGVRYIDTPFVKRVHQGNGRYNRVINYTGKRNELRQLYLVRNVVFEPTERSDIDWVSFAMRQIETAFCLRKPAIISSHRVNFCGHIDEKNRKIGITALSLLLKRIVKRWPDVDFMSSSELADLIAKEKENDFQTREESLV